MKSETVVRKRAQRLRDRYLRRHVLRSQEKRHDNCVHNMEILPRKLPYSQSDLSTELDVSPRRVTTLLVVQEAKPVRVCTYGSKSPAAWTGDICDSDARSCCCDYFVALRTPSEAADEFLLSLSDDAFVYENFRDLAALQWVLSDRRPTMTLWRRLVKALLGRFYDVPLPLPPGSSESVDEELENIWRE